MPEAIIIISKFPYEIKFFNQSAENLFNPLNESEFNFNSLTQHIPYIKDQMKNKITRNLKLRKTLSIKS